MASHGHYGCRPWDFWEEVHTGVGGNSIKQSRSKEKKEKASRFERPLSTDYQKAIKVFQGKDCFDGNEAPKFPSTTRNTTQ